MKTLPYFENFKNFLEFFLKIWSEIYIYAFIWGSGGGNPVKLPN